MLGLLLAKGKFHRGHYQTFHKTFFKKNSSYLQVTSSRKSLSKLKNWSIKKYFGGVCLTVFNTIFLIYRTIETVTIACSNKTFDNFSKVFKKIMFRRSLLIKSIDCKSKKYLKKTPSQVFFKYFSNYFINSQTLLVTWF